MAVKRIKESVQLSLNKTEYLYMDEQWSMQIIEFTLENNTPVINIVMPNSLTDTNISDTYKQVLHVSNGVGINAQKRVRDGDGTATAIMVSALNAQEAVKGVSVDGTSSADAFDLNAYDATKKQFGDEFIKAIADLLYPVGSLYLHGDVIDLDENNGVNGNDWLAPDPSRRFPGTVWETVSKGRFLAGVGNTDAEMVPGNYIKESFNNPYTDAPEFTWQGSNDPSVDNGEKAAMKDPSDSNLRVFPGPDVWWYNQPSTNLTNQGNPISSAGNFRVGYYEHQLQVTEMPEHTHTSSGGGGSESGPYNDTTAQTITQTIETDPAGGNQPHNNIPPYYGVWIWKRIK